MSTPCERVRWTNLSVRSHWSDQSDRLTGPNNECPGVRHDPCQHADRGPVGRIRRHLQDDRRRATAPDRPDFDNRRSLSGLYPEAAEGMERVKESTRANHPSAV